RRHSAVLRWMTALIKEERPDGIIVYAFGATHLLVSLAARLGNSRVPVLVSAGNPPARGRDRWKWRAIVLGSHVLRVPVHSCSHIVECELRGLGLGLPDGSHVIHNGCEVVGIAEQARTAKQSRPRSNAFI